MPEAVPADRGAKKKIAEAWSRGIWRVGKSAGLDRILNFDGGISDLQFYWILFNSVEDEKEKFEENEEYIKVLNMRLRPETSPELHETVGKTRKVEMPNDNFQSAISSEPDPKYFGGNNA